MVGGGGGEACSVLKFYDATEGFDKNGEYTNLLYKRSLGL